MEFAQKLKAGVKKHMANLRSAYDRQVKAAEVRAEAKMARARTKLERQKVKMQLVREKLALKQELYEAQAATKKAKEAVEKARKEAGDLTLSERAEAVYRGLTKQKRRQVVKTKTRPKRRK